MKKFSQLMEGSGAPKGKQQLITKTEYDELTKLHANAGEQSASKEYSNGKHYHKPDDKTTVTQTYSHPEHGIATIERKRVDGQKEPSYYKYTENTAA